MKLVLTEARFLRRYKRFLADVVLPDGTEVTAHLANTGSMTGCMAPDARCRVSFSTNPKRKLKWSVEQIFMDGCWILVNTARPNALVAEALADGRIPEVGEITRVQRERPFPTEGRVDFRIEGPTGVTWLEVKNATLREGEVVYFPDSVTARGLRHIEALTACVERGDRGILLLHVGTEGGKEVRPADHLDPAWAAAVREAPIEVIAYRAELSADEMRLGGRVPVVLSVPEGSE